VVTCSNLEAVLDSRGESGDEQVCQPRMRADRCNQLHRPGVARSVRLTNAASVGTGRWPIFTAHLVVPNQVQPEIAQFSPRVQECHGIPVNTSALLAGCSHPVYLAWIKQAESAPLRHVPTPSIHAPWACQMQVCCPGAMQASDARKMRILKAAAQCLVQIIRKRKRPRFR